MPKILLTDLSIRSLESENRLDFWDTKTPAFGIRVGPRSKTFVARMGAGRRALGNYPELSLQDARRAFLALKAARPSARRTITFHEAYIAFKAIHCSQKKARTQKDYLRMLDLYYLPTFNTRELDSITHRQISAVTDDLTDKPSECSHAIAVGRTFFKFCVRRHYISASPMEGMRLPKHTPRDRVLTDAELKAIWNATGDGKIFSNIIRLLILTGQRRGEIAQLRTSWIRDNEITIPKELTKNGREHTFPCGNFAAELLGQMKPRQPQELYFLARGCSTPFNGWMKSKLALDKKLGNDFERWTLHDLRRTFAANMAKLGVRLEVTEKLLNHISGSLGGIVAIYQRHDFQLGTDDAI